MKRRSLRLLIAIILLGFIGAISIWLYVFKKSDLSVASRSVEVEITVNELVRQFESNEEIANKEFLDKIILVIGNVESVNEDSLGVSIYLKDPDEIAGVLCSFSSGSIDIKAISEGETLKVKGLCSGYLMDVVLNKCSMVE